MSERTQARLRYIALSVAFVVLLPFGVVAWLLGWWTERMARGRNA